MVDTIGIKERPAMISAMAKQFAVLKVKAELHQLIEANLQCVYMLKDVGMTVQKVGKQVCCCLHTYILHFFPYFLALSSIHPSTF